jgi:hypothetical protein
MFSQQNGILPRASRAPKVSLGKQIVYRYNGDPKNDVIITDKFGDMPFRRAGQFMRTNGKEWKVAIVRDDFNMTSSRTAVPIHRVFLTDKF